MPAFWLIPQSPPDREGLGFRFREREMEAYQRLEDLVVYRELCRLHMPESDRRWLQLSVREDSENGDTNSYGFSEP